MKCAQCIGDKRYLADESGLQSVLYGMDFSEKDQVFAHPRRSKTTPDSGFWVEVGQGTRGRYHGFVFYRFFIPVSCHTIRIATSVKATNSNVVLSPAQTTLLPTQNSVSCVQVNNNRRLRCPRYFECNVQVHC